MCVGIAKLDNFFEGWGQVFSEMYAAQLENGNSEIPIYGLVTTGFDWRFAILEGNVIKMDNNVYTAQMQLQELLNVLNWVLSEASKNL